MDKNVRRIATTAKLVMYMKKLTFYITFSRKKAMNIILCKPTCDVYEKTAQPPHRNRVIL